MEINGYEIDVSRIAPPVVDRLLGRAISHILSNECSSAVLAKTKRDIVGKDGKLDAVNDKMLEDWRAIDANAKRAEGWADEYCNGKISAMYDGTLSVRVARAPSRDPIEAAARAIAKKQLIADLKARNLKFPVGEELFTLATADGDVQMTGDEMIDKRLAHPTRGPEILELAKRKVREDERLRAAIAKTAGGNGSVADLF